MTDAHSYDPNADRAQQLFDVTGLATIVTGAASGIGRAIAEVMAANGARLMLADVDEAALQAVADSLTAGGAQVETRRVDISDREQVDQLFAHTRQAYGRVDVVFANAGINRGRGTREYSGSLLRFRQEDWDEVMATNVGGAFHTIAAAAQVMSEQRAGSIVVTASTASLRAEPLVGYAYVTSKAAVANLVRQSSIELATYNVRINAIAPGPIVTNIGRGRPKPPDFLEVARGSIPMGRSGQPQELKGIALLLASRASSFVTGAIWTIDGGASALTQGSMAVIAPDPDATGDTLEDEG